jgi:Protein of unknown function with PCYCGC motif
MQSNIWKLAPLGIVAISLFSAIGITYAQQSGKSAQDASPTAQATPPYHKSAADAKPLPKLLPASDFSDRPVVAKAYEIANKIPLVLAQQPCYCHCDSHFGHTSLLDCFTSTHTAGCGVCMAETFFAYEMTKQGKTPAEIRGGIIRGDWKQVGLPKD